MLLSDLPTPCALVDRAVVERNTSRMSSHVSRLDTRLRPHVKTHKCIEAARLQVQGHFGGITVSTLAEARAFANAGFQDITYAVPLAPRRAPEATRFAAAGVHLNLLIDDDRAIDAITNSAPTQGPPVPVFLKIDCGYHRAGVDPTGPAAMRLAMRLHRDPAINFRGVLSHAGHSYSAPDIPSIRAIANSEREVTVTVAERLRAARIRVDEVSIGSTPTVVHCTDLSGVTEVRPGNYAFFDVFQATLGSCTLDDVAFSVLASIIGCYRERKQMLIDAGALALSKDRGATHLLPDGGFGVVTTADGNERLDDLHIQSLSQEHGKLVVNDPALFDRFAVGDTLRILPNHSCLAAACHDRFHVLDGDAIVGEWRPHRAW